MSARLLLVDDADEVRAIARLSLERVGRWTVIPASGGERALEAAHALAQAGLAIEAVLLDVMMPRMDGPETLRRLREQGLADSVPVVFLTAKTGAAEVERLLALGARAVIAKPFDPLALPGELQEVLARGARASDVCC
jgi:CheY-like chemotaxis protein